MLLNIFFYNSNSVYDADDTDFTMIVEDFYIDGNKLSLELKGKEDLVGNYYIDTYEELLYLKENIKYGVLVNLNGELNVPNVNTIPNIFNYKKYLNNKGIYYTLKINEINIIDSDVDFVFKVKNYINEKAEKIDNTGYMKAFILGNKDYINKEVYDRYQKIGITHLFALSGMHVGLLSGFILLMCRKFSDIKKYLIVDIFLIFYGFLVGFPSSIKRCILFFIINSINKIFKLNISSFKVLLLVIFILVFIDYKILYDVGFIYSVCTVGGIIVCNNYINHSNKFVSSFRLSLVAFVFSLPISLMNFYQINLLSIFYNIFYVPFVSLFVYPLCLISFFIPCVYFLFNIFVIILEYSSLFFSYIDYFCICLNFNVLEIIVFYVFSILFFYKGFSKCFYVLILIVLFDLLLPYFDRNSYSYFFDVGQGDSSLIISPFRSDVVLIDTGGIKSYVNEEWMEKESYFISDNVISFMKSIGINKINYLILTHGDYDHMGEAINLVENFKVEKVIFNCGSYNELEKDLIRVLDKKKIQYYSCISELNIGKETLYFLNTKNYKDENENSSVIYTEIDNTKLLFMGDTGVEREKDILKKYNLTDIDILKVGHHGSNTSSSKEFVDSIKPKQCLISVGKNNRYGHPKESVIDTLDDYCNIYRTDINGSVEIKLKNNDYKIKIVNP